MVEREPFYLPQRALIIVAHADDIEFGISGTIARWTNNGAEVTYVIVTDSGAGDNNPDADLDKLKQTRKAEQIASAKAVGVTDVRFLEGYEDGTLEPTLQLRKDLTRMIRQVRPNLVVTFDPEVILAGNRDYINHPDHRAVAQAAMYAVFPSAGSRPIFRDLLDDGLEPHSVNRLYFMLTNEPDLFIDISSTIQQKMGALRCHASQLNEEVVQMVIKWNKEAGEKVGVAYAEGFRVMVFNREDVAET